MSEGRTPRTFAQEQPPTASHAELSDLVTADDTRDVEAGDIETGDIETGDIETGDIVIDAALRDLTAVPAADLDGHIDAAEALQRTLQGRLANLGE